LHVRVLEVCDRVKDPLSVRRADFNCFYQVGKVLGEGVGGMPRVRGYGGGHSRSVARLEMAYGGPAGQGEGLEYEYSSRISQITRLKHAFSEKSR
jgi:hypothetical protein